MTPRLSAVMIARDEEAVIARCLRSLRGVADEVVLLDTGSNDRTMTVAWEHGAQVYRGEWKDDFAAARNEALACARGEWILWIDADEQLTMDPARVRAILDAGHAAYSVEIDNPTDDREGGERFGHTAVRLFRRGEKTAWTGRVHEQVEGLEGPVVRLEGEFIRHDGYRPALMKSKGKAARTIWLLGKALEETPDDAFQRFNLANALLVAGRPEEAYPHAVRATEGLPQDSAFGAILWHVRVQCAPEPLADAALADAAGWGGKFIEFERASAHLRAGEPDEALVAVDRCLELPWPQGSAGDAGIATHKARTLRAQALLGLGRDAEAKSELEVAMTFDPGYAPMRRVRAEAHRRLGLPYAEDLRLVWESAPEEMGVWAAWTAACESEGDTAGLLAAYAALAERQAPSPALLVNWGRTLEETGESDRALALFEEAVRRAPDDANACLNLADAYGRQGAWADAAHLYETALRLEEGNAQAWFTLGNAYAHAGHPDAAVRAYDRCLGLQPGHGGATYNRGIVAEDLRAA